MIKRTRARLARAIFCIIMAGGVTATADPGLMVGRGGDGDVDGADLQPAWMTQKNARIYSLLIPAPRGQIVDSEGRALASTKTMPGLYLRLPSGGGREELESWLRDVCSKTGLPYDFADEDIDRMLDHQKNRQAIPFLLREEAGEWGSYEQGAEAIDPLVILRRYARHYPEKHTAAHIVGYTGKAAPNSTKPLDDNDLFYPEDEGRGGLEMVFDEFLKGEHGRINIFTDEDGRVVSERLEKRPRPGFNVVTTLNLETQKLCEKVLSEGGRSGSIVILDATNGSVVAMASNPSFDPNLFVPAIPQHVYSALTSDASNPLFGRAFQAAYPPGSTFKTFVGLAALESGVVGEDTKLDCPSGLKIGNILFRNHSGAMGDMDIRQAMAQSCNTWFYQVGLRLGSSSITHWARAVGFGKKTGILLPGEGAGMVPDNDYMLKVHGRDFSRGDVANLSIGQGDILSTPLQMAQAMGIVANGGVIFQPRIVLQIQDIDNAVTSAYPPRVISRVNVSSDNFRSIRESLVLVTESGTGSTARGKKFKVGGKTGTAQWGPESHRRNVAWFAGFAPADNPKYAFAVAVEGSKGEVISGGKTAAPLAGRVIRELLSGYSATENKRDGTKKDGSGNEDSPPEGEVVDEGLVVDYSDLLERFVEEVESEEVEAGASGQGGGEDSGRTLGTSDAEIGEDDGVVQRPAVRRGNVNSNRTYDYVPEGMGRVLE